MDFELITGIVMVSIVYFRFLVYYYHRSTTKPFNGLQRSGANQEFALNHIGNKVHEGHLELAIDNMNADFIRDNLAHYLRHSQELKDADDGYQEGLRELALRFDCLMYHKQYKEEILRIFVSSAKVINSFSRLQELCLVDTVLSNQDVSILG